MFAPKSFAAPAVPPALKRCAPTLDENSYAVDYAGTYSFAGLDPVPPTLSRAVSLGLPGMSDHGAITRIEGARVGAWRSPLYLALTPNTPPEHQPYDIFKSADTGELYGGRCFCGSLAAARELMAWTESIWAADHRLRSDLLSESGLHACLIEAPDAGLGLVHFAFEFDSYDSDPENQGWNGPLSSMEARLRLAQPELFAQLPWSYAPTYHKRHLGDYCRQGFSSFTSPEMSAAFLTCAIDPDALILELGDQVDPHAVSAWKTKKESRAIDASTPLGQNARNAGPSL